MNAALAHDHLEPLDYELIDIRASALAVGDTIVAEGSIPLRITDVRSAICGLVSVAYECTAGTGNRVLAAGAEISVLRSTKEEAH